MKNKIFFILIFSIILYSQYCYADIKFDSKIQDINNLFLKLFNKHNDSGNSWLCANIDGNYKVFNSEVNYVKFHFSDGIVDYVSVIFTNKGDNVNADSKKVFQVMREKAQVRDSIKEESEQIENEMEKLLGKSKKLLFGEGKVAEKVSIWFNGDYAYIISSQDNEYTGIKIVEKKILKKRGMAKVYIAIDFSKQKLKENVREKDNGDVVIQNIPMINQGSKGYCTPAIWTRYLNYLGFYIDMYTLAQEGTAAGGGTIPLKMKYTVNSILSSHKMKASSINTALPKMNTVIKYIDQGLPLVWHIITSEGGHTRLIIGYNEKEDKIAYSDSWGAGHEEKWMTEKEAVKMSSRTPIEVVKI